MTTNPHDSRDDRYTLYMRRNLAAYPDEVPEDGPRIAGVAALMARLDAPLRLRLPEFDVFIEIDAQVGARKAYLLAVDDYEMADLVFLKTYLKAGQRALILGGGLGVTAALAARITRPEPVVVVEANSALHGLIARQVALNGGSVILDGRVVVGDVAAYPGGTVGFAMDEDIWLSRISDGPEALQVPVVSLSDVCAAHSPELVLMDIEGSEVDVLAEPVPECIQTLIVEIHTPDLGGPATARIVSTLADQGLRLVDQMALVWVFQRSA